MKKIIIALLFVVIKTTAALAQADSLLYDENKKFIYYQVVAQSSSPADTLYKRAGLFLKKAYASDNLKLVKEDKPNATLQGTGGVLVSKKSLVAMHEDAKITYTLTIEVKDDKYRYWLTNFLVTPYERDRYANYVAVPGKSTPLENGPGKISKNDFDGYMAKLLANCRDVSNTLKQYMKKQTVQVKEIKTPSVIKKDW